MLALQDERHEETQNKIDSIGIQYSKRVDNIHNDLFCYKCLRFNTVYNFV